MYIDVRSCAWCTTRDCWNPYLKTRALYKSPGLGRTSVLEVCPGRKQKAVVSFSRTFPGPLTGQRSAADRGKKNLGHGSQKSGSCRQTGSLTPLKRGSLTPKRVADPPPNRPPKLTHNFLWVAWYNARLRVRTCLGNGEWPCGARQ